jgi:hypothetical protein|tara:strand:+ start:316 stop:810 length:495 start_codon:yes stop_codon:yes gene_type:complete
VIEINQNYKEKKFTLNEVQHLKSFCSFKHQLNFDVLSSLFDKMEESVTIEEKGRLKLENFEKTSLGQDIINQLNECFNLDSNNINMHLYASIMKKGLTPNHTDAEAVLLINTYGNIIYNIYSHDLGKFSSYPLQPGDLLIIPKNIEHAAIPLCPRIVISLGNVK